MTAAFAWVLDQEGGAPEGMAAGGGAVDATRFRSCSWISAKLMTAWQRGKSVYKAWRWGSYLDL